MAFQTVLGEKRLDGFPERLPLGRWYGIVGRIIAAQGGTHDEATEDSGCDNQSAIARNHIALDTLAKIAGRRT
jgi:hypothetical protein